MKPLLHFSAILFLIIIGVSCSSGDDDSPPTPKPTPSLVNTPTPTATPVTTTPITTTPVVTTPMTTAPLVFTSDASSVIVTFKANIMPIIGVTSTGSDNATLQLNQTAKIIEINFDFTGLEPFLASFHRADRTFAFNYTPYINALYNDEYIPFTSPAHLIIKLSDDEITELMSNQLYIVLHTISNPYGEISGTFIKTSTSGGDD